MRGMLSSGFGTGSASADLIYQNDLLYQKAISCISMSYTHNKITCLIIEEQFFFLYRTYYMKVSYLHDSGHHYFGIVFFSIFNEKNSEIKNGGDSGVVITSGPFARVFVIPALGYLLNH